MKRSQILSHIRSLIIDELREGYHYSVPSFTVTKEQLPNLAEQLLDMLEFQGMCMTTVESLCDDVDLRVITYWEEE
jgi:hypothetical protein